MTVSLTHTTVAVGTEAGNGEIGKDEWNENHTITVASGKLLGRTTAGDGAVEEIAISDFVAAAGDTMTGTLTMDAGANVDLSNTTNANQFGVVTKGGTRFIHDFNYGNNGTVTTTGKNTIVGVGAGNLTMGSSATNAGHASNNTIIGYAAADAFTTANKCVAIGTDALGQATTTESSVAIGVNALAAGSSGKNYTVAIGDSALGNMTTGGLSVAIGYYAGSGTTSGTGIAIGFSAAQAASTVSDWVAVGTYALQSSTAASNTAVGAQAGRYVTSGGYNTFVGVLAGRDVTTGAENVAVGYFALRCIGTGSSNMAVGSQALSQATEGSENAAIGGYSLYGAQGKANYNTAVGVAALRFAGSLTAAGSFVAGIEYKIVSAGTTDFTLIGAANSNVGTVFTATGAGSGTGTAAPSVTSNTAIGYAAGYNQTTGNYNTYIGLNAGYNVTQGTHNVIIGYASGYGITTGVGNVVIGPNVSGLSSSLTDNIILASGTGGTVRAKFDGNDWWFSGSIGYATGQGGTVTQATSRTTGVTLNKNCGAITLVSAAGSTSWQSFTVTNSEVAATDTVIVNQKSGTDKNMIHVTAVAAGSFEITFATTGGTTTEQPVFNFSVLKAVAA